MAQVKIRGGIRVAYNRARVPPSFLKKSILKTPSPGENGRDRSFVSILTPGEDGKRVVYGAISISEDDLWLLID